MADWHSVEISLNITHSALNGTADLIFAALAVYVVTGLINKYMRWSLSILLSMYALGGITSFIRIMYVGAATPHSFFGNSSTLPILCLANSNTFAFSNDPKTAAMERNRAGCWHILWFNRDPSTASQGSLQGQLPLQIIRLHEASRDQLARSL